MFDHKSLDIRRESGERLDIDSYVREFGLHSREIRDKTSWKFERRQNFQEDTPGRRAFGRGDWEGAMRILEEKRASVLRSVREELENRAPFYRVRVVAEPLSAYVQWELRSLRMQAECGSPIRVVDVAAVTELEAGTLLPEVVVLGDEVLYELVYSEAGVPEAAIRFTDPTLISGWVAFARELYGQGEDVISYVDRVVAHLPPPRIAR